MIDLSTCQNCAVFHAFIYGSLIGKKKSHRVQNAEAKTTKKFQKSLTDRGRTVNDKQLADAVVATGVLDGANDQYYPHHGINERHLSASEFVRDWRVAGALMTQCRTINYATTTTKGAFCSAHSKGDKHGASNASNGEEARAVVEACVEALDLERQEKT